MIKFSHKGNFDNTERFLKKGSTLSTNYARILEKYAIIGVNALSANTPIDSGKTAGSWDYKISITHDGAEIIWTNSNDADGTPIAILIQYGHATRNGGYVQGRDFINPVMQPIFDKISNDLWMEVSA